MFSGQVRQIEELAELDAYNTKEQIDALNEIEELLYEMEMMAVSNKGGN